MEEALVLGASPAAFSAVASVESFDPVALEEWVGQSVGLRLGVASQPGLGQAASRWHRMGPQGPEVG